MICSNIYIYMSYVWRFPSLLRYQPSLIITLLWCWTSGRTEIETLRRCAFLYSNKSNSEKKSLWFLLSLFNSLLFGEFHRKSSVNPLTELSFASTTGMEKHHKRTRSPEKMTCMSIVFLVFRKWERHDFLQRNPLRDFLLQGTDPKQIAKAEVTDSCRYTVIHKNNGKTKEKKFKLTRNLWSIIASFLLDVNKIRHFWSCLVKCTNPG